MKLLNCAVKNFGSYADFEFNFNNQGLALIHGATGSGKSTVCDMACWILYGVTAKNGAADDVRNWQNLDEPTTGTLEVELQNGSITVTRIRGRANQNDLFWQENKGDKERGKDLIETQKNLEKRLGVSLDSYLASAYFSEFSSTATFFVSKAKDRREVLENITDLEFPAKIAERVSNEKRIVKKSIEEEQRSADQLTGKLSQLQASRDRAEGNAKAWISNQQKLIANLELRHKNFERERQIKIFRAKVEADAWDEERAEKLESLRNKLKTHPPTNKCPTCGNISDSWTFTEAAHSAVREIEKLEAKQNPYYDRIRSEKESSNHYSEQILERQKEVNTFEAETNYLNQQVTKTETQLNEAQGSLNEKQKKYAALNLLYDLSFSLRSELLQKSVKEIEHETNRYVDTYFDGEIKVNFELVSDNIDVIIQKSGYPCVYKQLSKGQRGILKLAFVVSVMQAAANKIGTHFSNLYFDEALDGLDTTLKTKAFALFEELSLNHETILVVDHCEELKEKFDKRFYVTLSNDNSMIQEENG